MSETHQHIILPYHTPDQRSAAAEFVAVLVRAGVTFIAVVDGGAAETFRIDFTGGY